MNQQRYSVWDTKPASSSKACLFKPYSKTTNDINARLPVRLAPLRSSSFRTESLCIEISRNPSIISSMSTTDYVGFADLPNQVFRRCIKNGFDFTLMVVGELFIFSKRYNNN